MFGRDEKIGGKRTRIKNVKYFSTFQTDGYKLHHSTAHAEKWEEYQRIKSTEDKEIFFASAPVAFGRSLHVHLEFASHLKVKISAKIVDDVVADLLFHQDDNEEAIQKCAMAIFKKDEDCGEDGVDTVTGQQDDYVVVVKSCCHFDLCIRFVASGASFRMASCLMDCIKDESGMSVFGGCSDVVASNYTCIVCVHSLQILSDIMQQTWAFTLAFDGSAHQGMSCLDIQTKFHLNGCLFNFHLMAIPLFEKHTGENMFVVLKRLLDSVFYPTWKLKCISVFSDGVRNMTGSKNGLVTHILKHFDPGIIQIWCGLHQLDLVLQHIFKAVFDGKIYSTLMSLIRYLWHQQNIFNQMQSTCPKVADTWWISMHSTTKWLVQHCLCVTEYLNDKTPLCAPNTLWWIFLHAIQVFAFESQIVFASLH